MGDILRPHEEIVAKNFSALVGKVLTQVEASMSDPGQRKSFKKIVEQQIYDCRNTILNELNAVGIEKCSRESGVGVDKPGLET